jgi:hypothetical protein
LHFEYSDPVVSPSRHAPANGWNAAGVRWSFANSATVAGAFA